MKRSVVLAFMNCSPMKATMYRSGICTNTKGRNARYATLSLMLTCVDFSSEMPKRSHIR